MRAPTATELLNHPTVRQAIEEAWKDSLPQDANRRHEEGGWIYLDTTGGIVVRRATAGLQGELNPGNPPQIPGPPLRGPFRTHPKPTPAGRDDGTPPAPPPPPRAAHAYLLD